jgi:hypothetical protein
VESGLLYSSTVLDRSGENEHSKDSNSGENDDKPLITIEHERKAQIIWQ